MARDKQRLRAEVAIALSLLLSSNAIARGPRPSQALPSPDKPMQVIRSEADLVVLPVSVTDHRGNFVPGLTAEDFHVYENGQLQSISQFTPSDIPVTAGLVIDSSASMAADRPEVARAAKDFVASSNSQDQIFVINFNERVSLGLPAGVPFTSNVAQLESAVLRGPSTGMTALYDAISLALKHLALGTEEKKALIIISDGDDNASHRSLKQVLNMALHSNAILYTIGIFRDEEDDMNPGVLRKLAQVTGGRAFFPDSAADLKAICREIARDLREQYTLAYVPADAALAGGYRTIRVSVHAPGKRSLIVRTRTGYIARPDLPETYVPDPGERIRPTGSSNPET